MIVSPDLAAFLVVQTDWLGATAATLRKAEDSSRWVSTGDRLVQDLVSELWCDGRFCVKAVRTGKLAPSTSLLTLVPLVAAPVYPAR